METKVVTGKVRLSYVNVFKPKADENGEEKYSIQIIISKDDKDTLNKLNAGIEGAKLKGKDKCFGGKIPAKVATTLRDGDEEKPDQSEYLNSYFMNISTKNKPVVVGLAKSDEITPDMLYSGCYGRVSLNFYAYSGKRTGITAELLGVQYLEEGVPLGTVVIASKNDFFDGEEDENDDLLGYNHV